VFKTMVGAQNAISRTLIAQQLARESLVADFRGFKPLQFNAVLTVEEFQLEAADDPYAEN
jgi:hypothetical protein